MSFETYSIVFCVVAGSMWGVVYFFFKALTNGVGVLGKGMDRNDNGRVKFFGIHNIGLYSGLTMVGFFWIGGQKGSFVASLIEQSWHWFR